MMKEMYFVNVMLEIQQNILTWKSVIKNPFKKLGTYLRIKGKININDVVSRCVAD